MSIDLRVKHDLESRRRAVELFDAGVGCKPAAEALSVPRETVREWQWVYRAFGSEALLSMDGKQSSYTFEQRVAAASAVVDDGMAKADAMAEFGIRSKSPLERWCRLYREGGAEALRPRPKGRPGGVEVETPGPHPRAGARGALPQARGRGRLPKKIARPGRAGRALTRAAAEAVRALRAEGHSLRHLLECSGLRRSTYYYALAHPRRPTRPELRDAAAEIFSRTANGCGHRQIAMCLRAELGAVVADKTVLKMMREMGIRCGIRRRGSRRRYSSYRGLVGSTFENVIARDFGAEGPWQKLGTDVTEFKVAGAKAYWAPVLDFCTKEIVASDISTSPDLAQQHRMLDRLLEALPDGAAPTMHSDMGWQYQHESYTSRLEGAGITQSMSRKGNCIDNAATEQLFGHVKDEFYRGREWGSFGDFKRDLEGYIAHWNTRRRQVRLKGLTPEEFRNRALAA